MIPACSNDFFRETTYTKKLCCECFLRHRKAEKNFAIDAKRNSFQDKVDYKKSKKGYVYIFSSEVHTDLGKNLE